MQFSDKVKHFINGPHGMNMGTRDAGLKPEYARVLGASVVDDQHIHVYFDGKSSGRTLHNLEDNQLVALIMVSLENFESYQYKGKAVRWEESNAEDLQKFDDYMVAFNEGCARLGFPDGGIYKYPHSSMMTLLMHVEEIYEQTPRVGTGQRVNV